MKLKNHISVLTLTFGISAALFGCVAPSVPNSSPDPLEGFNRQMHAVNKGLDKGILKPLSAVYSSATTEQDRRGVENFMGNLREPADAINHLLQGRHENAAANATRFLVNSTIGIFGLADIASQNGIFPANTDFGQTLGVWGVPEGPYVELPIAGPQTARSGAGYFVDQTIRAGFNAAIGLEPDVQTGITLLSRINDRAQYGDLIDLLLYQSADSYSATRIAFLQNRRAGVAGDSDNTEVEDFYDFE